MSAALLTSRSGVADIELEDWVLRSGGAMILGGRTAGEGSVGSDARRITERADCVGGADGRLAVGGGVPSCLRRNGVAFEGGSRRLVAALVAGVAVAGNELRFTSMGSAGNELSSAGSCPAASSTACITSRCDGGCWWEM